MRPEEIYTFFKPQEYSNKIAEYPTSKLQAEDKKKLKKITSSSVALGSAVVHAVISGGVSLAVAGPLAARSLYIAKQKSSLIRAELTKRGVPLAELTGGEQMKEGALALVSGEILGAVAGDVVQDAGIDTNLLGGAMVEEVVQQGIEGAAGVVGATRHPKDPASANERYCAICFGEFDTSLSSYLHCYTCTGFDVCQNCAVGEMNAHPKSHVFVMEQAHDFLGPV